MWFLFAAQLRSGRVFVANNFCCEAALHGTRTRSRLIDISFPRSSSQLGLRRATPRCLHLQKTPRMSAATGIVHLCLKQVSTFPVQLHNNSYQQPQPEVRRIIGLKYTSPRPAQHPQTHPPQFQHCSYSRDSPQPPCLCPSQTHSHSYPNAQCG